jgi:hypothetical protein
LKNCPHCRSEPDWRIRVRRSQRERMEEASTSVDGSLQNRSFSHWEKVRMRGLFNNLPGDRLKAPERVNSRASFLATPYP